MTATRGGGDEKDIDVDNQGGDRGRFDSYSASRDIHKGPVSASFVREGHMRGRCISQVAEIAPGKQALVDKHFNIRKDVTADKRY